MNTERLNKLREMEAGKPADAFIKFAIALEYQNAGQHQQAIQQFELVLNQFPDYIPTYYQAGKLYEELDQPQKAIDIYQKGIKLAQTAGDNKTWNELKEALMLLADE